VYFEALWNAHGRKGSAADFFKGLIKVGAAGVKRSLDQRTHAEEHLERATELFKSVRTIEGEYFLGFHLETLLQQLQSIPGSDMFSVEVYPEWGV
jgi:hypothetical protein